MQKLRHSGERQPELKAKLRKYLNSKTFQKAFRSMVSKSIRNGAEHAFEVELWPIPGRPKIRATPIISSGSPDSCVGLITDNLLNPSKSSDSYKTFVINMGKKYPGVRATSLINLHTHPFITKMSFVEPAAELVLYHPRKNLPSPRDVRELSVGFVSDFEMIVPVDIISKELHILVYQNVTPLSYVAYEGLWEEVEDSADCDRIMLKLAVERSILRVLELDKRKKAIITPAEVDLILETMELKRKAVRPLYDGALDL